ncbi:MAG TPA: DNA-processing protein DprA [Micromonosporaceae bacterium]
MLTHHQERLARMALAHLVEPGRRDLAGLIDEYGPVDTLRRLRSGSVGGRLGEAMERRDGPGTNRELERVLAHGERLGARVVIPEDEEWPQQVTDLVLAGRREDADIAPPVCLWVRGGPRLDEALRRSVALVGARAATEYGRHVATELGFGLADRGWTVVSGGAYGIDAAAHRGALAAGGVTVAVFACGVDTAYPVGHVSLFERIVEDGGLLVSEWPPGVNPQRHRFLVRNRLIAAATTGTVVVEAAARSGSRATLARAHRLARATMAVPGPVTSAMSVGTHLELREGRAHLVTTAQEVLEEVGRIGVDLAPLPQGGMQPRDALSPDAARVLDAVPAGRPVRADRVADVAGLPVRQVHRVLPQLVVAGMVEETSDGYRLAPDHRAPTSAIRHATPTIR